MSTPLLFTPLPIHGALDTLGEIEWIPWTNSELQMWLMQDEVRRATRVAISKLPVGALFAMASEDCDVINRAATEVRFPEIQLNPWPKDGSSVGIFGLLRLISRFLAGEAQPDYRLGSYLSPYNYMRLRTGGRVRVISSSQGIFARVDLKYGLELNLLEANQRFSSYLELYDWISGITPRGNPTSYTGVVLPQWKIPNQIIDVGALIGMSSTVGWRIVQAKMAGRTTLGVNGVSAEAAFTAQISKGVSPALEPESGDLVIGDSCIFWITQKGSSFPLLVGQIPHTCYSCTAVRLEKL